jgi:two-component system chemotaxis sensor kinase CheA
MAASLGFKKIENISHSLEELLLEVKEFKKGVDKDIIDKIFKGMDEIEDFVGKIGIEEESSIKTLPRTGLGGIRVNVELLDRLQNTVGELIVSSSHLSNLLRNLEDIRFKSFFDLYGRNLKDLQDIVTEIRLVPLSLIFNKFPRYVRDLSEELGKKVSIEITGSDIEVDRSLLEGISEPLIHLIRNAISHGIEKPQERKKLKKPITGKVEVSASRVKDEILIEVSDDGKGIDENEVVNIALMKNLIKKEDISSISRKEILHFLLMPGFTTDKEANELSGRGIGLDVVKQIVRTVGGSVDIKTERNKGTTISMKMPLSMAIIRVYLFESDRHLFAIPMTFVEETLMITGRLISNLMGCEVILLRGEVLPVYHFSKMMERSLDNKRNNKIYSSLIVKVENEKFVLIVDRFRGSCDAVIKPLPAPINKIKEYTGITIIGDGTPCLIIDLPSFRYRRIYENTGS